MSSPRHLHVEQRAHEVLPTSKLGMNAVAFASAYAMVRASILAWSNGP